MINLHFQSVEEKTVYSIKVAETLREFQIIWNFKHKKLSHKGGIKMMLYIL